MMMLQKTINEHNPNWPQNFDHPYRILIIGGPLQKQMYYLI